MLGHRATFRTRTGEIVQAMCVEVKADLPYYDIEVVNGDGEVVEYLHALGHTGLTVLAASRKWTPTN